MLSALDEMPWHPLPTTFDHIGTSDPRFFDRHWFAIYNPHGPGALQMTMGVYNNMNVVDGGIVVTVGDKQYNVRASRSLRPRFDLVVGPLRIEIVEPLQKLRLTVGPGQHPISGELIWTATHPPEEERGGFLRKRGRVVNDQQRYDQVGRCDGTLTVGDHLVEIEDWWTARDHSWGLRPGMGVEDPVTGADDQAALEYTRSLEDRSRGQAWGLSTPSHPFLFFLIFFTSGDWAGHILADYAGDKRVRLDGTLHHRNGSAEEEVRVVDMGLVVTLAAGTQRFTTLGLALQLEGGLELDFEIDASGPAIVMEGLGYSGGYNDGRGLGKWRGDIVEWDVWDVSHVEEVTREDGSASRPLHRLQPVRLRGRHPSSGHRPLTGTGSVTLVFNSLPEELQAR